MASYLENKIEGKKEKVKKPVQVLHPETPLLTPWYLLLQYFFEAYRFMRQENVLRY